MDSKVTPASQRIVDGVCLTEYREGLGNDAPTLVMVHGGCHGAWCWQTMQEWFATRNRASIALDWFSHGGSDSLPDDEWLSRDILAVANEIEIACGAAGGRVVVMGHSMGGLASLAHAASTPSNLAALVLLAPVVPRQYGGEAVDIEVDFGSPWGPPPPEAARTLFYSGVDDESAVACYANLQPESPAAVHQATRWTGDVDVQSISVPTLVVAAEEDLLVPLEYVTALTDAMGADSILLPGVGHGVTLDPGSPAMSEQIESWLASVID